MDSRTYLNLRRLVSRLENAQASLKDGREEERGWYEITSTLSTVNYARGLLTQLEDGSGFAGPSRATAAHGPNSLGQLRQRIDRLEQRLTEARDVFGFFPPSQRQHVDASAQHVPRPAPARRAPLELRPTLPQIPVSTSAVANETGLLPVESDDLLGDPTPSLSNSLSRPPVLRASTQQRTEPDDISSLLSHHREVQDELANDLAGMAKQLKLNTLHFSSALEKDKAAMTGLETRMEGNLTKMTQEKGRLGAYARKGGTTTCFVITAVLGVTMAWSFMFLIIRYF